MNEWGVISLDHSDERFGVEKTIINGDGKYQSLKYKRTFSSYQSAKTKADQLNKEAV